MTTAELGQETRKDLPPEQQLVAGRYRLHARIGHGRLGDIYAAEDEGYRELGVGRRLAVQLLPDRIALDNGLFSKLKLGYTVLRAQPHPNVVRYFDIDHDGKFGYLVMELLDGVSLRFILDDVTTLPLDEAMPVVRAIGDALQYLHAKSIVHGRLQAGNVFVTDDLDVRLLDVVPLDAASTILRGVASRDPFSRCDTADDTYGLACLTYEMLAGKHPFNFHPRDEAHHAGLQPARIASLPAAQWNALGRGLSFDPEKRIVNVGEFLRAFGVTGTERLRPSEERRTARDPAPSRVPAEARPLADSGEKTPEPDRFGARADPPIGRIIRPEDARGARKRRKRLPSAVLLLVLIALGTWYGYGTPRDDIAVAIDYLDGLAAERLPWRNKTAVPVPAADSAPATVVVPVETQEVAATPVGDDSTGNDAVLADDTPPAAAIPLDAAQAAAPGPVETGDTTAAATSSAGAQEPQASITLIQSAVTISERDGAARITARRPANTAGRLYWWTENDTAVADQDFIPLESPVEGFVNGDVAETVHIPLINDSLPESTETFYVFLGQRDAGTGRLQPISRVRVEISDDD